MALQLAYVIMPVGSDATYETKRLVIEEVARRSGWRTHFPLDPDGPDEPRETGNSHFSLSALLEEMTAAALVVADLSLERPSCYFELGLAQALGRPTLMVAGSGTPIHQVADRDKVRFYSDLSELRTILTSVLERALR